MFERMRKKELDLQDGIKILRFVLLGKRSLAVNELLYTFSILDDPDTKFIPSDGFFQRRILSKRRIISCGGNFLEIKPYHGTSIICPDSLNPPG